MDLIFRWPVRVYYEDTDAAGIVYHANYLKYMERARTEWLRALGFEQTALARQYHIAFVVRSADLEFLRPARFDDELVATVENVRCGRASLECRQVVRAVETDLCTARIRVGCADLRRMAAARMPDEVYRRISNAY